MEIQPKEVLPRVLMIINSMLAEEETTQIDFSHQQFSIQITNRNHLTLNWYAPQLTDLQWSLEFTGISNLKHISVSHFQNNNGKRVKILFWRNKTLNFYQAQIIGNLNTGALKTKIIESEKIISLPLSNNDEVLYISQDLTPTQKPGVFFIETIKKDFFVLKATSRKQQLIQLNQKSKIAKLYSQVLGFLSSSIESVEEKNDQKIVVSNILMINQNRDKESFKAITLQNYQFQIRFVNVPVHPRDKIKSQTYQLHGLNLRNTVLSQLEYGQHSQLVRSEIYERNENEVMIIFLIRSLKVRDVYYFVSVLIDYKKIEEKQIARLKLQSKGIVSIDFISLGQGQSKSLILARQFKFMTILSKICLTNLRVTDERKVEFEGGSKLSVSQHKEIFLLSPLKVYEISIRSNKMMAESSQSARLSENGRMQQNGERGEEKHDLVKEVSDLIALNRQKVHEHYQSENYQQALEYLTVIETSLNDKINAWQNQSQNQEAQQLQLQLLMKIWTSLYLYKSILILEQQSSTSIPHQGRTFTDLNIKNNKNPFKELSSTFNHFINFKKLQTFISIWISFLQFYHQCQFFSNSKIRRIQSEILQDYFSHIINKALSINLRNKQYCTQIINFIRFASGIIRIQKSIYRTVLNFKSQQSDTLKKNAIQQYNLDLINLIFFQYNQISKEEIKQFFKRIKQTYPDIHEQAVRQFVQEYLQRMKSQKIANPEVKYLINLLFIFSEQNQLLRKIIESSDNDLKILFYLRDGKRTQKVKQISEAAQNMKNHQNREVIIDFKKKLALTVLNAIRK